MEDFKNNNEDLIKGSKNKLNMRKLRISLKYRPEIYNLIVKMQHNIKEKMRLIREMQRKLKHMEIIINERATSTDNSNSNPSTSSIKETIQKEDPDWENRQNRKINKSSATQTEENSHSDYTNIKNTTDINSKSPTDNNELKETVWNINNNEEGKSLADQVKEVAQSALQQTGMVYVESAGMYYDYKTGYYYNSELGLYYHTDTGCYYYYAEDKKEFVFHSYPDRSALAANASLIAHEKRKARKHKKAGKTNEDIDELTKKISQEEEPKPKKKKKSDKKAEEPCTNNDEEKDKDISLSTDTDKGKKDVKNIEVEEEIEDGECSETESENSTDEESIASTATASDDDAVAKHHPPCMRVIVRETNLAKLKVGSLFLITKDGGSVGREGNQHTILLKDHNVSRNHLDIKYDMDRRMYMATDLGSKNGTLLNGSQMSQSQVVSNPMEIVHGSIIQLGETKLLCHIHAGNDTCGHCEPGLIMETQEKEKAAYTRTCSVQKQHHLELARLKNKYAPEPLMIEDGAYNDRAKARRETVGSTHHSEKTQTTDVETSIAPENKGFKLLEKMGWSKGEGLGKDNQGDTEPIPLVSNEGKVGLGLPGAAAPPQSAPPKKHSKFGAGTLRLAARSKLLQPPAKAFQNSLGDDEYED